MSCYVYILQSLKDQSFYVGYTCNSVEERLARHNRPHKGHTGKRQPWELVYFEEFESQSKAMAREREIKSWKSKKMIEELIG